MKIELTLTEQKTAHKPLPQAELLTGATGYLLLVQMGDRLFSTSIAQILDQIALGGITDDKKRANHRDDDPVHQENENVSDVSGSKG